MSSKVAIVMGVKNEVELIALHIEHHLKLGIHKMYIIDCDSSDGSKEILQEYASHPQIHVVFSNVDGNHHNMHRLRLLAFADPDVDYLLYLDPDEFLVVPSRLSLPDIMSRHSYEVFTIRRYNTVPIRHVQQPSMELMQNLHQMLYYISTSSHAAPIELPNIAALFQKNEPPKVLHATIEGFVDNSGHGFASFGASSSGQETIRPGNMFLAHFPITSLTRFKTRAANIFQKVQLNPTFFQKHALHWWVISEGHRLGILDEMYASATPSANMTKMLLNQQEITFGHKLLKLNDADGRISPNVRVGNILSQFQADHLQQLPQDKIFI